MKNYVYLNEDELLLEKVFLDFFEMSEIFVLEFKDSNDLAEKEFEIRLNKILEKHGLNLNEDKIRFGMYVTWRSCEGAFLSPEYDLEFSPDIHRTFSDYERVQQ